MGYGEKLHLNRHGKISNRVLNRLTATDWQSWITDCMHGKVYLPVVNPDDEAYEYFSREIPYMNFMTKIEAYEGLHHCLNDAFQTREAEINTDKWDDYALLHLLVTVEYTESYFTGDENKLDKRKCCGQDSYFSEVPETIVRFLDVLRPKPYEGYCIRHPENIVDETIDMYHIVLDTISSMGITQDQKFWKKQLEISNSEYGPVCFRGAMNIHYEAAISLLPHVHWDHESTRKKMEETLMEDFFSVYRSHPIAQQSLHKMKARLPMKAVDVIDAAQRGY